MIISSVSCTKLITVPPSPGSVTTLALGNSQNFCVGPLPAHAADSATYSADVDLFPVTDETCNFLHFTLKTDTSGTLQGYFWQSGYNGGPLQGDIAVIMDNNYQYARCLAPGELIDSTANFSDGFPIYFIPAQSGSSPVAAWPAQGDTVGILGLRVTNQFGFFYTWVQFKLSISSNTVCAGYGNAGRFTVNNMPIHAGKNY